MSFVCLKAQLQTDNLLESMCVKLIFVLFTQDHDCLLCLSFAHSQALSRHEPMTDYQTESPPPPPLLSPGPTGSMMQVGADRGGSENSLGVGMPMGWWATLKLREGDDSGREIRHLACMHSYHKTVYLHFACLLVCLICLSVSQPPCLHCFCLSACFFPLPLPLPLMLPTSCLCPCPGLRPCLRLYLLCLGACQMSVCLCLCLCVKLSSPHTHTRAVHRGMVLARIQHVSFMSPAGSVSASVCCARTPRVRRRLVLRAIWIQVPAGAHVYTMRFMHGVRGLSL